MLTLRNDERFLEVVPRSTSPEGDDEVLRSGLCSLDIVLELGPKFVQKSK
jgi:hypothetical protein